MSRALLNKITLTLAVFGCFIALVLSYQHFFHGADIGCRAVGGDCHKTIESAYDRLGPIPTSILGLGMYLTLAGICILRARSLAASGDPGPEEKRLGAALFGISALAFCASWWLQYVSFFVILSFCPWCFASALTVTAILLVNFYDHLIVGRVLTGEQKMLSGVVLFIGLLLGFLHAPEVIWQVRTVLHPPVQGIKPILPNERNPIFVHPREELLTDWLAYKGKPTAAYTIVEFADYGCGHCKEASEEMDKLVKKFPDRYRLAFRNFPLGRWPWSMQEAAAAEAAGKQGKFWEMHDLMFEHQPDAEGTVFNDSMFPRWAKTVGLDVPRFMKDMNSEAIHERVIHDHITGQKNRVDLTPSFFVIPSDPKGKVLMIIGGADAKLVLNDPNDPFWRSDQSSLKNPEKESPAP